MVAKPETVERVVGEYRLEARIGRGAMGEVWLGRHVVTSGIAAIKVMRESSRGRDRVRKLFERERRAVARLAHPHIVGLFEIGSDYLVTAFIDGADLARRLKRPIDAHTAMRVTMQIASALAYAHRRGIVHRDVKPSNILLDRAGNAYLTDFGIAILDEEVDETQTGSGSGSTPGARAGTPAYMAPEQQRGEGIGPAVDQYALARTLAEMLAGVALPREPEDAIAVLPPSLPERLRGVLARATERAPERRFATMEDFAAALVAIDLSAYDAPARLGPELRDEAPFAWCARARELCAVTPEIARAEYLLSDLESLLGAERCAQFRAQTGYADFGWSVVGQRVKLGAPTEPAAFARASEAVVLVHGTLCTRRSFREVAAAVARDNAVALVLVPDMHGFGDSRFSSLPTREQVGPQGIATTLRLWRELIGVSELPTVVAAHSMAAAAILSVGDDALGPRVARIAVTPVFPAADPAMRRRLRMMAPMLRHIGVPPVLRLFAFLAGRSPEMREFTDEVKAQMREAFLRVPPAVLANVLEAYADSTPVAQPRHCAVVVSQDDPLAPVEKLLDELARLGVPPTSIHRLVSGGHFVHAENMTHPEWTARNLHDLITVIDSMLVSTRGGTDTVAASSALEP
jgi:serine/threonine-protein kinase